MIPKDKAIELVSKFMHLVDNNDSTGRYDDQNAKLCALIVVDEVLAVLDSEGNSYPYWQQVKEEIKKL